MRIKNKIFFASILFFLISFVCVSQNVPPPNDANRPPPPPGLPIDGGVLIVAALGIIYGITKSLKKE